MIKRYYLFFIAAALSFLPAAAQYVDPNEEDVIVDTLELQTPLTDTVYVEKKETKKSYAASNNRWQRKKYWNFGYSTPSVERTDDETMDWETDFSVTLQRGRTANFPRNPIAGMLKIGIDYSFMDITYSKLKLKSIGDAGFNNTDAVPETPTSSDGFDEIVSEDPSGSVLGALGLDLGMHKLDYTIHVGPRFTVNPVDHLMVSAYFHGGPAVSGVYENDEFSLGYGYILSAGLNISYKLIGIGVEGVWGSVKYKQLDFEEFDMENLSVSNLFSDETFKLKQKGPRFYISLRF